MTGFLCTTCGEIHGSIPICLGAPVPDLWHSIPEGERADRVYRSSDQCVIDGRHFFILGRILLPVVDDDDSFVWLAWVSLSEANFVRSGELWESEGRETEPPYFGWLQSALPGYTPGTRSLKTNVQTMPLGQRPLITLEPTNHPLAVEQREGITMDRVQQIAEAAFHG